MNNSTEELKNSNDLISRAEAIAVHDPLFEAHAIERIKKLPSVQPTSTNAPNTLEPLDCVDRKAVLKRLTDISYNHCKTEGEAEVIGLAKTMVSVMPSVQPEIIRCRDCKHGKGDIFDRGWWCELHPSFDVDGDDYCSYAERRTDERTD